MPSAESLEKQAIKAAVRENWPKAVEFNLCFLKLQSQNTTALNRLAWAYTKLGQNQKARASYKKVLSIDKNNPIARKNLKRLPQNKNSVVTTPEKPTKKTPSLFLEESGKTKVVNLLRIAPTPVLNTLDCASPVELIPKTRFISVRDHCQRYLGILPDDLSFRLLKLIAGGNRYEAWIKSIGRKNLQIFIRETKRSPNLANQPSFQPSPKEPPLPLRRRKFDEDKPEMTPTGEEESAN
ncbi:MAG: tetratricopeptide repeat protein [Candidatus Pacebacteria bacterium]|nr:tetratricopeptide repeat protein [Candidatus Paceibacterota bacterium]